jgi:CheY-like chemotaxis protein
MKGICVTAAGKTIAILAANPALSALLTMVLAGDSRLRVRPFDSEAELFAYMRIAPLDLLVVDFDREGRPAYEMVEAIRLDPSLVSRDLPVIAMTRAVTPPMRQQAISAGIDEVLVKPMSPRHLLQRVQARLLNRSVIGALGFGYRGPERRNRVPMRTPEPHPGRRYTDNVVPLFPDRRAARPDQGPLA